MNGATDGDDHGDDDAPRVRPGPLAWIRYAYGAGLPARHRAWVLHDVTARTWVLRHLVRGLVQFLPFGLVVFLVVPVDKGVLALGLGIGFLVGLAFSTAFVDNVAESRAMRASYPEGYATRERGRRRQVEELHRDLRPARGLPLRLWPRRPGGGDSPNGWGRR